MTQHINTDDRSNWIGSLWMISAMALFALEDAFIKAASATLPVGQVLIMFGVGGAILFATLARFQGQTLWGADVLSKPMKIRAGFEIGGRLFYALALALTPLSSATAIMQATPLVVVAGAALIFGETVGIKRWIAIFIGLLGVVVIIQPGSDSFSALSILAVLGMIGFAGRDLASRAAPASLSAARLGFFGFVAIFLSGIIASIWAGATFVIPQGQTWLLILGFITTGALGYGSLMKAMRIGEVSAVTPFRYSRLIFGVALSVIFFKEGLETPEVIGCGLIVISGMFILWRGRQKAA